MFCRDNILCAAFCKTLTVSFRPLHPLPSLLSMRARKHSENADLAGEFQPTVPTTSSHAPPFVHPPSSPSSLPGSSLSLNSFAWYRGRWSPANTTNPFFHKEHLYHLQTNVAEAKGWILPRVATWQHRANIRQLCRQKQRLSIKGSVTKIASPACRYPSFMFACGFSRHQEQWLAN